MHENMAAKDYIYAGYKSFDKGQYTDALNCFSQAVALESGNTAAREAYNLAIQMLVPRYHFNMLNDIGRNEQYDRAIRQVVDTQSTVLDVGTGSGLLSMMAARAGAQKIYTCEVVPPIAEVALAVIASNGYANRIQVIAKKSDELVLGIDIPKRLDILVTETIDSALIGEGIIPIIKHARKYLLKPDAKVLPMGATVFASLVESETVLKMNRVDRAVGFDVSGFNQLATSGAYPVRLGLLSHRLLCEPIAVCQFDFEQDGLERRQFELPIVPQASGMCHAVAFWFDLYLNEATTISNAPSNSQTHWKQAIQCLPRPIELKAGTPVQLSVKQDLTRFDFDLGRW
jgi:type II protein arginine methyltransferase